MKKKILVLLVSVKSLFAFDDQYLAVNTYIAGVINNTPSVAYQLRSNPSVTIDSFNTPYNESQYSFYRLLNLQSSSEIKPILQLFFDPIDATSKDPLAIGSIVITIDTLQKMIIITVEEKLSDSIIVHSKEVVFLSAARSMIRQAFLEKKVRNNQGTIVPPSYFDTMKGGSVGLYLVITHDGTVKVDGGEFSCSSTALGLFYSVQSSDLSCDVRGLLGADPGTNLLGAELQETTFRTRCVKSMNRKAVKMYMGVQ
jgi:hypothetical protein